MRSAGVATVALLTACNFTLPRGGSSAGTDAPGGSDSTPVDSPAGSDATPVDTACPDADGDTICDVADKCPGGDDRLDGDADGIPDACDAWLCGNQPGSPNDPVGFSPGNSNLAFISFAGEGDQTAMVAAGTVTGLDYAFGLQYNCPGGQGTSCREQIEVGYAGVGRLGCLVDLTRQDGTFLGVFNQHANVPVPTTPGQYDLRVKEAANASCGTSDQFTGGEPPSNQTVAIVCVPP
jgi:hypothetical protein